jgi:transposase
MKKAARTVKKHLEGTTAILNRVTNARAEGLNAIIQKLKADARGYRSRERFRNAIYFHCGGLDLYPDALSNEDGVLQVSRGLKFAHSF